MMAHSLWLVVTFIYMTLLAIFKDPSTCYETEAYAVIVLIITVAIDFPWSMLLMYIPDRAGFANPYYSMALYYVFLFIIGNAWWYYIGTGLGRLSGMLRHKKTAGF